MLMRQVKALGAAAGAFSVGVAVALGAPAASAEESGSSDARCRFMSTGSSDCLVEVERPQEPEQGTQPVVRDEKEPKRANFCDENTPGDQEWKAPFSCETNWDPVNDCVWTLMSPQPAPPAGADPSRGAWEQCNPTSGLTLGQQVRTRWWESTGEEAAVSPATAARTLVEQFELKGVDIGMVPFSTEEGGTGAVGLPAWMWVENTDDPLAWGPYETQKSVGGLVVTATARPLHVTWDMGNGDAVVCKTAGTPYDTSFGKEESPDCGYTYMEMGDYTVSAITTWSVEWTAGGQSGVIETVSRSSQDVQIGEFQALNVRP